MRVGLNNAEKLYEYVHEMTKADPAAALGILISCVVKIIQSLEGEINQEEAIDNCCDLIKKYSKDDNARQTPRS